MTRTVLWLALAACSTTTSAPESTGSSPIRALSPDEYNRAVRDLFGYGLDAAWPEVEQLDGYEAAFHRPSWPWLFPAEVGVEGFDGFASGQIPSPYSTEQVREAAAHFARFAVRAPAFSVCGSWHGVDDPTDCARASILRLANRAYRRPLTADEEGRLLAFHDDNVATWGPRAGTELTVQGLLQSPQFLFQLERTGDGYVDDWEMATRLSLFLWDSMPDAELFEAAAAGALSTADEVGAQARRMLADPRAREAVVRFHSQWLELDQVYANRAELSAYAPTYLPWLDTENRDDDLQGVEELWSGLLIGTRRAMVHEAELFIGNTIFQGGGTLEALLTDHHGFVSTVYVGGEDLAFSTADLYEVRDEDLLGGPDYTYFYDDGNLPVGLHVRPATLPAHQRAGILTLGAVLAARAHSIHPAPVLRGVFVMERLACIDPGQPPDGADLEAPPDALDASDTNRERVDAITMNGGCAACHTRINPLGYAFESYDSLGGWRDTDNGKPVDTSGQLRLSGDGPRFSGAVELAKHLAAEPMVQDCYAKRWTEYAVGRHGDPGDAAGLAALQERFRTHGDVRELLVDIATSDLFRARTEPAATSGGAE